MDLIVAPGTLLASAPDMLDPNFMHTVVLMCQHTAAGAYGLVVNKPAGVTIGRLLSDHPRLGADEFPVCWGGPVGMDTLQIVHRLGDEVPGGMQISAGVHLGGDLDAIADAIAADRAGALARLRFVIGYSGWGEGQLDGELAGGAWLPAPLRPDLVFERRQHPTWRRVIRSIGRDIAGLEDLPPDVSWN